MDTSAKYQVVSVVDRAASAFECLADGDMAQAARVWSVGSSASASDHLHNVQIVDAANAGLGALLVGNSRVAQDDLERAANLIALKISAVSAGDLTPRVSSSSHHFRLASQNVELFAKASIARHERAYVVMRAIISHHNALLHGDLETSRTRTALTALITETFGAASVEAFLMLSQTFGDMADYHRARAHKLRAVAGGAFAGYDLTPDVALAAIGIMPFLPSKSHLHESQVKERA